jgi:hypothetical protein
MEHHEIAIIQGDNDNTGSTRRRRKQGALASVYLRGGIFCRAARLICGRWNGVNAVVHYTKYGDSKSLGI